MTSMYRDIIHALEAVLREIGEDIRRAHGNTDHSLKAHAYDVLTESDVAVERRLKAVLAQIDPNTPVFGEETGGDTSSSRYWMIDPIDGTIHFVRGMPFFTAMLVLIVDHKPAVSIIYDYTKDDFYWAVRGEGAFVNDQPIRVSARPVDHAVILAEINRKKSENSALYARYAGTYKMMELVCAGYEFVLVATGKVEGRVAYEPFGKPFDFAPGALLVQEAGGVVRNFDGREYTVEDSNFIAAASEEVYQALRNAKQQINQK